MYRWLVGKLTRAVLERLRAGDPRWILALAARDIHFRFLGSHSWAADFRSKAEMQAWLRRYVSVGLRLIPLDIAVSGPPWNTVVFIRFTDTARGTDGTVIYENEGVLFERLAWGRIREHISYEDTQRTVAFDRRLEAAGRKQRRIREVPTGARRPEESSERGECLHEVLKLMERLSLAPVIARRYSLSKGGDALVARKQPRSDQHVPDGPGGGNDPNPGGGSQ